MSFSNLFFLFIFLPISLLLGWLVPKRGKNAVLLGCSLIFFAWGTPEYLLLMICSILFHYITGRQIELRREQEKSLRWTLITTVAVDLLLLGFFKYYGFLVENINGIFGTELTARELPMPIGLSFFTFSMLSYTFDVAWGKAEAAKNIADFSLYVTFFPKLVSGPIVPYHEMQTQLRERELTSEDVGEGVRLFIVGLGKKVLLSNVIGETFYALSGAPEGSVLGAWLGAIAYSLMLYYDFSGYSDMAIGLGRCFGFRIPKNFDYPYISSSITEFWRRWHISLGGWFKNYVYIPLGGSRCTTVKNIRNLLVVWLLTGLWHGASWSFVAWGLYYGILLILEKYVLRSLVEKLPGWLRHGLTLLLVVVGWVFFFSDSLGGAFRWLGRMFGGAPFMDTLVKYHWSGVWLPLLLGIFGATPVAAGIVNGFLRKRGMAWIVLSVVFAAIVLLLSIAGMMNDTYSSFLYFQF